MFESAELGPKVTKRRYAAELPELRSALLKAHLSLKGTSTPLIIIISGADGAGKGELIHRFNEWFDPRGVDTQAFWQSSDEERDRPRYWKFWRALPERGRIGIFFGSWYTEPVIRRVHHKITARRLDLELDRIAFFEQMLANDGALIIKFWLHLSRKKQLARLKDLESNPRSHWRVLPNDWEHFELYEDFMEAAERSIRRTDAGHAPWHILEASDKRHRDLAAGRILLEALEKKLREPRITGTELAVHAHASGPARRGSPDQATILSGVDLTQKLDSREYKLQLSKCQSLLSRLAWAAWEKKVPIVAVFEGWDAAGKGSGIRRVTEALDPRLYRIVPVAAPTDEERRHHYLWRFWKHIPRKGITTLFDRSWYGRVLVERVEGFAREDEWRRAYLEINDFEDQLAQSGMVLSKFWIHISKDEQLRRFKLREKIAFKQHKITDEDWRNRKNWNGYQVAVNDMVARTSTKYSPWTIVAGNDKKFARIQILKALCDHIKAAL